MGRAMRAAGVRLLATGSAGLATRQLFAILAALKCAGGMVLHQDIVLRLYRLVALQECLAVLRVKPGARSRRMTGWYSV